jgi:hypothetical protein
VIRVDDSNRLAYGLAARVLFGRIARARVGLEVGTQQHFTYELFTQSGFMTVTERHTVASQHVAAFARFSPAPRIMYDVGIGFHYFDDYSRPGAYFGLKYILLRGSNWSIPVGMRVHSVLDDFASLTAFTAQSGIALRR